MILERLGGFGGRIGGVLGGVLEVLEGVLETFWKCLGGS